MGTGASVPDDESLIRETGRLRGFVRALLKDRDAVEDVIQESHLAALRTPPPAGFEPGRWLRGVAGHLARRWLRTESRRRRREQAAARPEGMPGPGRDQDRLEQIGALIETLRSLDEIYRMPLVLRYFEGRPVREIAEVLGVPAETVKTRLRRGLARVRERLDARSGGDRAAWVVGLAPLAGGLGTASAVTSTIAASLGAILAMKTKLSVAAAVLVLAGAWTWIVFRPGAPATIPLDPPAAPAGGGTLPDPTAPETGASPIDAVPFASSAGPAEPAAEARRPARIRGRCVAAAGGPALPDCAVTLHGWAPNRGSLAETPAAWEDPPEIRTAPDGAWEFAFDPPSPFEFLARVTAPGRVPVAGRWSSLGPGDNVDCGDIVVPPGVEVGGMVVDENGRPVEGVRVSPKSRALPFGNQEGEAPSLSGLSDRGGRFRLLSPMLPGSWRLERDEHFRVLSPAHLEVPEGVASVDVPIVVAAAAPPRTIEGEVTDERGRPIEGAMIQASHPARFEITTTRSNARGRFMLRELKSLSERVRLSVSLARGFDPLDRAELVEWGARDVRMVLRRSGTLELEVVAAVTGEPIGSFGVRCFPEYGPRLAGDDGVRLQGDHPGGRLSIAGVSRRAHVLSVIPSGEHFVPTADRVVVIPESGFLALRIEVHRREKLPVRVVTADDVPVSGSTVELIEEAGPDTFEVDSHAMRDSQEIIGPKNWGRLRDTALTDAAGRATVSGPVLAPRALIRVKGPHRARLVRPLPLPADGAPLRVEVSPGATLRGRLEPREIVALLRPCVTLCRVGNPREQFGRFSPGVVPEDFRVRDDGTFELRGLGSGAFEVYLGIKWENSDSSKHGEPLTVVHLRDDDVTETVLDAARFRPGRLKGRIVVDGQVRPLDSAMFSRCTRDAEGRLRMSMSVPIDPDGVGRFDRGPALPAWYVVSASISSGTPAPPIHADSAAVEVRPGEDVDHVFELSTRTLRVRVLTADGSPAADRPLRVFSAFNHEPADVTTDAAGWFTMTGGRQPPLSLSTPAEGLTWDSWAALPPDRREAARCHVEINDFRIEDPPASIEVRLPSPVR